MIRYSDNPYQNSDCPLKINIEGNETLNEISQKRSAIINTGYGG